MNSIEKQVAARLRAARKAAGFKSAKVFTDKFKLAPSTYSQHETGQRSLTLDRLMKYSECLEVQPTWLLTGEGQPYKNIKRDTEKELFLSLELVESKGVSATENVVQSTIKKNLCVVDMKLFCDILKEALSLLVRDLRALINEEVIDFCIDVYNTVITVADPACRNSIIQLAINSMLKGYDAKHNQTSKCKI